MKRHTLQDAADDLFHDIAFDDPGMVAIGRERRRVLDTPDRSIEHDVNEHRHGELVDAAMCYLLGHGHKPDPASPFDVPASWPWDAEDFKPGNTGDELADRRRDLVRAGQLIAAELARMDTAAYRLPIEGEERRSA